MRTTTKHFDASVKDSIDNETRHKSLNFRINAKAKKWNGDIQGSKYDKQAIDALNEFARLTGGGKKAKVKDSTRAMIGRKLPNGKIRYIYNHWDGYPEGVGAILSDHYSDPEKVDALLNGGDISYLGSTPSEAPWDDDFDDGGVATRFYRTRGEKNIDAREGSLKDFEDSLFDVSYLYLLGDDNKWSVKGYDDREWKPLKGYKKGYGK